MSPAEPLSVVLVAVEDFFAVRWLTIPTLLLAVALIVVSVLIALERIRQKFHESRREQQESLLREREDKKQSDWVKRAQRGQEMPGLDTLVEASLTGPAEPKPRELSPAEQARAREQITEIFSQVTSIKQLKDKKERQTLNANQVTTPETQQLEQKLFQTQAEALSEVSIDETQAGKFAKLSLGGEFLFEAEDLQESSPEPKEKENDKGHKS